MSRHRGPRHARFSRDGVGHRGAKPERRYELLAPISLLSPAYLLSVERWPFHAEPPAIARLIGVVLLTLRCILRCIEHPNSFPILGVANGYPK